MSASTVHAPYCTACGEPCRDAYVIPSDETISEEAIAFAAEQGHVIVEGGMVHVYLHADGGESE